MAAGTSKEGPFGPRTTPVAPPTVLDWRMESPHGPPHELPRENVLREMEAAGYVLAHEYTFLPDQYFLVFVLPRGR